MFIDGRPVDLKPAAAVAQTRSSLTGTWSLAINLGEEKTTSLNLRQEGNRLTGSIQGPFGSGEIANASAGNEVRFTVVLNIDGQTKEATFSGAVAGSGNEIRGGVTIEGRAPGTFTATRSVPN